MPGHFLNTSFHHRFRFVLELLDSFGSGLVQPLIRLDGKLRGRSACLGGLLHEIVSAVPRSCKKFTTRSQQRLRRFLDDCRGRTWSRFAGCDRGRYCRCTRNTWGWWVVMRTRNQILKLIRNFFCEIFVHKWRHCLNVEGKGPGTFVTVVLRTW